MYVHMHAPGASKTYLCEHSYSIYLMYCFNLLLPLHADILQWLDMQRWSPVIRCSQGLRSYNNVETYGDGTILINGRRCTCNDRRRWTCCRCFVWLIPTLAVLTVSWSLDYMQTFGLQEQSVLLSVIYIYLCVLKYSGWCIIFIIIVISQTW